MSTGAAFGGRSRGRKSDNLNNCPKKNTISESTRDWAWRCYTTALDANLPLLQKFAEVPLQSSARGRAVSPAGALGHEGRDKNAPDLDIL